MFWICAARRSLSRGKRLVGFPMFVTVLERLDIAFGGASLRIADRTVAMLNAAEFHLSEINPIGHTNRFITPSACFASA